LDTRISPISILGIRYFEKNYGKILRAIPENSGVLEIGPGGASFAQYLLHRGYKNITVCEVAGEKARALSRFFGDSVKVIHRDAIDYLGDCSDRFDFIYAAQVVEHFHRDDVVRFLSRCYSSLNNGGYMIFETINCANVIYGQYLRYCDHTHRMGFTPRSLRQFLLSTGDFSRLRLIEIYPPGILDLLYCLRRRATVSTDSGSAIAQGRWRKAMALPFRSFNVRLSRWLSYLFLRHYEFERLKIYTPFFAVIARKNGGG
jgi:SAM-dependent methyltransferase